MKRQVICAHCSDPTMLETGAINRARKAGLPLYCSRVCFGLAHRHWKTKAQLVAEKAAYDEKYRADNAERLRVEKAAYFQATYDKEKAREVRAKRMPYHVEYCRCPEYRKWKKEYDKGHLAKKQYGEFAEAAIILNELEKEILDKATRYEIDLQNGKLNKSQNRKREHARFNSGRP